MNLPKEPGLKTRPSVKPEIPFDLISSSSQVDCVPNSSRDYLCRSSKAQDKRPALYFRIFACKLLSERTDFDPG